MSKLAPYNPAADDAIAAALAMARLQKGERVLDLGCGDGKFLLYASRESEIIGVGYEYDSVIHARGEERLSIARAAGGREEAAALRVELVLGDACTASTEGVDVIFVYLVPSGLDLVRPLLEEVLAKPSGRVLSNMFKVPGLQDALVETRIVRGCSVYLYSRRHSLHSRTK